jgi:hypothetical protein
MKPWLSETRGRQLEAFLGVWGIKTSEIETTNDLLADACTLYGVPISMGVSVDSLAEQIESLGRKERKARVEANIGFFPERSEKKQCSQPITQEGLEKVFADSKPKLVPGASQDCVGELNIDPARLLKKVISAVISHDQGHILYDFPEVLEFMGSRIPHPSEVEGHTGIDTRMFEAKAKWPNLIPGTPT